MYKRVVEPETVVVYFISPAGNECYRTLKRRVVMFGNLGEFRWQRMRCYAVRMADGTLVMTDMMRRLYSYQYKLVA